MGETTTLAPLDTFSDGEDIGSGGFCGEERGLKPRAKQNLGVLLNLCLCCVTCWPTVINSIPNFIIKANPQRNQPLENLKLDFFGEGRNNKYVTNIGKFFRKSRKKCNVFVLYKLKKLCSSSLANNKHEDFFEDQLFQNDFSYIFPFVKLFKRSHLFLPCL